MTDLDLMCLCGDPKSEHKLGRKGCKALDCGCGEFEAAEVVPSVEPMRAEDLAIAAAIGGDPAVEQWGAALQQSTSARLRAVEAERDEALGDAERARGYWHNCSADRDAIKTSLNRRERELGQASKRIGELEQLLADAGLKLVQQGNEYSAELVRLSALLETAEARGPRLDDLIFAAEAQHCVSCRWTSTYEPHPHPTTPVRVVIHRTEGPTA